MGCAHTVCHGAGAEHEIEQTGKALVYALPTGGEAPHYPSGEPKILMSGPRAEVSTQTTARCVSSITHDPATDLQESVPEQAGRESEGPRTGRLRGSEELGATREDESPEVAGAEARRFRGMFPRGASARERTSQDSCPSSPSLRPKRDAGSLPEPPRRQASGGIDRFQAPVEIHQYFVLLREIGSGSFSRVWAARALDPSFITCTVAVKAVELKTASTDKGNREKGSMGKYLRSRKAIEREASILEAVSGKPHCLKSYGMYDTGTFCFVVSELCNHSLLEWLEGRGERLNAHVYRTMFFQMFTGLAAVHKADIIHRDIKPDNFLVNMETIEQGRSRCVFTIKLCDFGLAVSSSQGAPLNSICGTAPFMSPEMLNRRRYDDRTDVWSMGALMYVLVYGEFPYSPQDSTPGSMKEAIKNGSEEQVRWEPRKLPPGDSFHYRQSCAAAKPCIAPALLRDDTRRISAADAARKQTFDKHFANEQVKFTTALQSAKAAGAFDLHAAVKRRCQLR